MDKDIERLGRSIFKHDINKSFVVNLTNRCNIKCKHCFQDSAPSLNNDKLKYNDILRVVNHFNKKSNSLEDTMKWMQLTGGEVTLHDDFFDILELGLRSGYHMRVQTNGITIPAMSEDELKILGNPKVFTKISLDGWDEKTHGYLRPPKSFSLVISGINRLLEYNKNVGIKTVIHEKNHKDISKMITLCEELGVASFTYNFLRKEGRASNYESSINEMDTIKNDVLLK